MQLARRLLTSANAALAFMVDTLLIEYFPQKQKSASAVTRTPASSYSGWDGPALAVLGTGDGVGDG